MFDHHLFEGKPTDAVRERIVAYYVHLEFEKPPFALFIPVAAVIAFGILIFRTMKYRSILDALTIGSINFIIQINWF